MKRIRYTGLVMIASLLLLSLFLGSWLISQYKEQQQLLVEDLQRGFEKSEEQVMDSILAIRFVNPMVEELQIAYETSNDSIADSVSVNQAIAPAKKESTRVSFSINTHITQQQKPETTESTITYQTDSAAHLQPDTFKMIIMDTTSRMTISIQRDEEILFQGMRMFVKSYGKLGTDSLPGNSLIAWELKADTFLLKSLFTDFLHSQSYPFDFSWSQQTDSTLKNEGNIIILKNRYFNEVGNVEISDFRLFLIQKIGPQLFFASILLLIISLAFRMAYRNMKSQRRLITLKNDFISNITHELKTPVATVKVALEALKDFDMKNNQEVVNEYLTMSSQEMDRLDDLVGKILNTTALEEGRKIVILEKTDLSHLVLISLESMRWQIEKAGASLETSLPDEPVQLMLDPLHIRGLITNLIDNSLKYAGEKPIIQLKLKSTHKEWVLSISDNGPGIPEEYLLKIFEKFFRVPRGNTHDVKGHGLGLYYAQVVASQHGARISARNPAEGGCEFSIHFPIQS